MYKIEFSLGSTQIPMLGVRAENTKRKLTSATVFVKLHYIHVYRIISMDMNNDESSKEGNSAKNGSDKDESEIATTISNVVSNRAAQCRNSVLASQIQKALPAVTQIERRTTLHAVLQQLSEESLVKSSDQPHTKEKHVVFHIPKKSIHPSELIMEEISMPAKKNKLLTDSFVRNLPVPIQEKRLYRQSIAFAFKRKPWYTKFYDFMAKKHSNWQFRIEFWNDTFKLIEGQHGATMISYFFFIRWLLYMNIIIFLLNFFFIVMPRLLFYEVPSDDSHHSISFSIQNGLNSSKETVVLQSLNEEYYYETSEKKGDYSMILSLPFDSLSLLGHNITNASSIDEVVSYCQTLYAAQVSNNSRSTGGLTAVQNILQGTGPLEPTHLFMGFYPPYVVSVHGYVYNMSVAFLVVLVATFIVCFIMMIQYTTVGIQEAFLAYNQRSYYYSNEVFSAWDYCIDKPIGAAQQHYQFVFEMKTNLSEDRTAKEVMERSTKAWAKLYVIRLFINIFILLWLFACYYLIYKVAMYQMKELHKRQLTQSGLRTFFIQFLAPATIIVLNSISPIIFSLLVTVENYHAQTQLNLSLFRNVFLYLSSIIVLLNTFYQQIACKPKDICGAGLNINCRSPRCWETYVGQQLFRLTLTDLFAYVGIFLCHDVVRNYVTRNYDNKFTRLVGHLKFFLPTEVLAPVNSQTILWLGVFYSPLLPLIMILKLIIIFYIKKTKLLKFCDPSEQSFRASRFNAVFIMILMISFFVVLIVQSFAIERIPPSRGCGPFRNYDFITSAIPEGLRNLLSVLLSSWTIIFIAILLCVAIHYYQRVLITQKELAKRLKAHLVLQSHDKQFLLKQIASLANGNSSKKEL